MDDLNNFDGVIATLALIAAVMGFMTGLLRSLATILAYLVAAPLALAGAPLVARLIATQPAAPRIDAWILLAAIFVVVGVVLGALLRAAVGAVFGPRAGLTDRTAGAVLGVARIAFAAVLLVLVFDRLIPAHLQPDFLAHSRLRPYLSAAGAAGLRSLPPEIADLIDRLKRERNLI